MDAFDHWFKTGNYILSLHYDAVGSSCEMVITECPESGEPRATFILSRITGFTVNRYHPPEDVSLGDCLSYELKENGDAYLHTLDTGDALITIEASGKFEPKSER